MSDKVFSLIMMCLALICVIMFFVYNVPKLYLYIKMKRDGETISTVSKGYLILGIITEIFFIVFMVMYLIYAFKNEADGPFPAIALAYFPAWFFSSVCFIGDKSAVIGIKRYYYSDIVKIDNDYATYKITMADGKVKKPCVMYGRKILNEELKRVLPDMTANLS